MCKSIRNSGIYFFKLPKIRIKPRVRLLKIRDGNTFKEALFYIIIIIKLIT